MKKLLLLLFIFALTSVSALAQSPLQEILKRMDEHQKALMSLKGDVTLTKFSVQLGGAFAKEGAVKFLPVKSDKYYLRIDWTKPETESFVVVNNEYILYSPNQNAAFTGKMTDAQNNTFMIFQLLSSFTKAKIKANFAIKYTGTEKIGATSVWHLELTPKIATSYGSIELWVDGNGMPVQSKVVESNGDWTSARLTNLAKNAAVKGTDFQLQLPKGVNLKKN